MSVYPPNIAYFQTNATASDAKFEHRIDSRSNENSIFLKLMSFNLRNELLDASIDGKDWHDTRRYLVKNLLRMHLCDIIGTQEGSLSQLEDIIYDLPKWYEMSGLPGRKPLNWFGSQLDRDNEYCEIFFNDKNDILKMVDKGTFSLSENPSQLGSMYKGTTLPRIATWILFDIFDLSFDISTNYRLLFINTHLDHMSETARRAEMKIIESFIEQETNLQFKTNSKILLVFITGDFNEGMYKTLWKETVITQMYSNETNSNNNNNNDNNNDNDKTLYDCVDYWQKLNNKSLNFDITFHQWNGMHHSQKEGGNDNNGAPIDWILCNQNVIKYVKLKSSYVVTSDSRTLQFNHLNTNLDMSSNDQDDIKISYPSDHFPLILEIEIPL